MQKKLLRNRNVYKYRCKNKHTLTQHDFERTKVLIPLSAFNYKYLKVEKAAVHVIVSIKPFIINAWNESTDTVGGKETGIGGDEERRRKEVNDPEERE